MRRVPLTTWSGQLAKRRISREALWFVFGHRFVQSAENIQFKVWLPQKFSDSN